MKEYNRNERLSMDYQEINLLLERQFVIQDEMEKLSKELNEISLKLYQLNNQELNKNINHREEIRQLLESKGYIISGKTQFGSQTLVLTKDHRTLTVLLKQSKYYTDKPFHAWYTFNSNVVDFVDIFLLIYFDSSSRANTLVIDNSIMKSIIDSLSKMSDGKMNIQLTVDNQQVIEYFSKTDLSNAVNNFKVF